MAVTDEIEPRRLTAGEARELTDEVRVDAASLWRKLVRLREGDAHIALNYSSWGEYFHEEFGQSGTRGYQLLEAGRVLEAVESHSTVVERPAHERVVRELTPVLRARGPEAVAETWTETVERHGSEPTAQQVREVVQGNGAFTGVALPGRKQMPVRDMGESIAAHDAAWAEFKASQSRESYNRAYDAIVEIGRAIQRDVSGDMQ